MLTHLRDRDVDRLVLAVAGFGSWPLGLAMVVWACMARDIILVLCGQRNICAFVANDFSIVFM